MSSTDSTVPVRQGEAGPAPTRSNRTFQKADGWYFMTRERVDVGPFATQDLAETGVQDYAGFSMDADKVYLEAVDVVVDESGLSDGGAAGCVAPVPVAEAELFDRRRGDEAPAPARSSRVFQHHGGWYFATREGGHIGPFPTEADAERGVVDYVSFSIDLERTGQEDS